MCRACTPYWYTPMDVALCPSCAETTPVESLPTKKEWCDKERALMGRKPIYFGEDC